MTTTYLEQTSVDQLVAATTPREPVTVVRAEEPCPEFSRFLLTGVGSQWHWSDKLPWTWRQWFEWITRPGFETWVGWLRGTPVGYAELAGRRAQDHSEVEVESFGLLPAFFGRGFGGHLLTVALAQAWRLDQRWAELPPVGRIWLHTRTLDSPHALPNYLSRGMRVYTSEVAEQSVSAEPPGPWEGARAPRAGGL